MENNKLTLQEIITTIKDGNFEKVDHEELCYAVLALDALLYFDSSSLRKLLQAEQKSIVSPFEKASFQYEESFNRQRKAMEKPPKDWVGWNNDPKNSGYQEFRAMSIKIADKILDKAEKE